MRVCVCNKEKEKKKKDYANYKSARNLSICFRFISFFGKFVNAQNIIDMARSSSSITVAAVISSLLLLLLMLLQVNAQQQQRTQAMQVDALRNEYLSLEQALWQYLGKTANSQNNRETQLRKVYDSHWDFIHLPLMNKRFDSKVYSNILHHYEWTLLEVKLTELNSLFDFYKVGTREQTKNI